MQAPPTRDGPWRNEEIRVPQVRLIDQDGEMMGVMGAWDACPSLRRGVGPRGDQSERRSAGVQDPRLWQVQIRTTEEADRGQEETKGHREIKEIKVLLNIDENDYQARCAP